MRFQANGPAIPDSLLDRCDAGRVVFLCGAGVSLPAGMPTFIGLTQHVVNFFDPPENSDIMKAFKPWLDNPIGSNMPLDQLFNLLHQEYGKDEVNALVTQRLAAPTEAAHIGYQHSLIKRISSNSRGIPQIVTTNFDLLFELDGDTTFHVPPAFPDLTFGSSIEGITYLHGRLAKAEAEHHPYVLSSADFGRAYLSEAWATNFIRNLLDRYTVVLVGYQAEDPPIKYLLQGLNHDGQYDRSKLYAFDRGRPEDIEAKWRDRGVSAIAYADHEHLWQTMEAWAERADDPRAWRASVIRMTSRDPKDLLSHERGQVAHVLRTVQGAKLFSEAQPPAHPEWICVMDANVRSAAEAQRFRDGNQIFDPKLAYGLDDDLAHIPNEDRGRETGNDNLLVWRHGDDTPTEFHRLGGRAAEGYEAIPPRLWHLITWIGKSLDSPVLAWWAIRQNGLHPRLLQHIEWKLGHKKDLHERGRRCWNLVVEYHKDPRNREWDGNWYNLKERIATEGWTASVLRDLRRIGDPRVDIKPPYGLGGAQPPHDDWGAINLADLGQFEVKVLDRHGDELEVPDEVLAQVFGILQDQLLATSGLLSDIGTQFFKSPTCYPGREVDGEIYLSDAADAMVPFLRLLDRLIILSPDVARGNIMTWPIGDQFFFRKLTLYALAKTTLFDANDAANKTINLDQDVLWDSDIARELLFMLVDRWRDFTEDHKQKLSERLLSGPNQMPHWSDDEYPQIRDEFSARYGRYLELQGCALPDDQAARLRELITGIKHWNDGWAASTAIEHGSHSGWVGTDEASDAVIDLPVNKIVERAKDDLERDFASFTEKRPFTGLSKANPRKALAALTVAGKKGDYPEAFWSALITEFPDDTSSRLKRQFLRRLMRLPHEVIQELRYPLARWLERKLADFLAFDEVLGWSVFDHIVSGLVAGGREATQSGIGESRLAGQMTEQSRRTVNHAINGPIGMCAEALFHVVSSEKPEERSLVPEHIKNRLERLFAAPGEGSDHAVTITLQRLNWLMYVDPAWSEQRLIPMLAFEHPAAEPAWNGFLNCGRHPWPPLAQIIKPLLLASFPWLEQQSWGNNLAKVAGQWLGLMCIFKRDEPDGLTKNEMRTALRNMTDGTRNSFIFWLGRVGQGNENGWNNLVAPFLREVWPRERAFRTASSVNAWIGLLDDTGDSFPVVYAALKPFLAPMETDRHPFYRFTRTLNDEKPITSRFPEATLDLIHTVTPRTLARPLFELPNILSIVVETEPGLMSDPRYLRLIDLVERG